MSENNLILECICGEEIKCNYKNYFDKRIHITREARKDGAGTHGVDRIINVDTGEEVRTQKIAQEKGWIPSSIKKKEIKEEKKEKEENIKKELRKEIRQEIKEEMNMPTTITGGVLETKVDIHPLVYNIFVQSATMLPDQYKKDDRETFSNFILDLALFYRGATKNILPWSRVEEDSINRFRKINEENSMEKEEKKSE